MCPVWCLLGGREVSKVLGNLVRSLRFVACRAGRRTGAPMPAETASAHPRTSRLITSGGRPLHAAYGWSGAGDGRGPGWGAAGGGGREVAWTAGAVGACDRGAGCGAVAAGRGAGADDWDRVARRGGAAG